MTILSPITSLLTLVCLLSAPAYANNKNAGIVLDGDPSDWDAVTPIIKDARSPVIDNKFEGDIHQLKAWHDTESLYLYVSTTKPPQTAIEEGQVSSLFVIYIDADGNDQTGCQNVRLGDENSKVINGYDLQLVGHIGNGDLGAFSKKRGYFARYTLYAPGGEEGKRSFSFSNRKKIAEKDSFYKSSHLKPCPSGIELKLPLDKYMIKRNTSLRFVIHKQGNMHKARYSEAVYVIDGQTTKK